MERITNLSQLGGHRAPLLLSGGFFFTPDGFFSSERAGGMCPGAHGRAITPRGFENWFCSIRVVHTEVRQMLSAAPANVETSPTAPDCDHQDTVPYASLDGFENSGFTSGKHDVQIRTGNLLPSCTELDFSSPPACSEPVNVGVTSLLSCVGSLFLASPAYVELAPLLSPRSRH